MRPASIPRLPSAHSQPACPLLRPPPLRLPPAAIKVCGPGVAIKEIGRTIHAVGDQYGYGVVKVFVGHGVGTVFHSWPHIAHHRWVPAAQRWQGGREAALHAGA